MDKERNNTLREKLHELVFEANSKNARRFDIILMWLIVISVLAVMLESVENIRDEYSLLLTILEWTFTVIFTIEYILRIIAVKNPWKYIFSFYGIVDFLSIVPTYLGFFFVDGSSLRTIRILRLMRIFRVFKLLGFIKQGRIIVSALRNSRDKIIVFMFAIGILVVILGTIMYIVESHESGFTSIPRSIYWSIVTITTVGYGDIAPSTALGQSIASIIMIMGYAIIAVPTGIVTSEFNQAKKIPTNTTNCANCMLSVHDDDAIFCKNCGEKL